MITSERITATGFEKAFIKSWSGWDEQDTATFTFYDAEFQPNMGLSTDVHYESVNICLEKGIIEVYDGDACVAERKFELTLKD